MPKKSQFNENSDIVSIFNNKITKDLLVSLNGRKQYI